MPLADKTVPEKSIIFYVTFFRYLVKSTFMRIHTY